MNKPQQIPADTILRQRAAASPAHSAWVAANAGSGKTEVLVQRVVRLLLDGAAPSSILCLTFTKAAAAQMTNRVFKRLSQWIPLNNTELSKAIQHLTGSRPSEEVMKRARRLFAEAIETPGGLKVQTIHAFCERLLHLFPFDANVPANFAVMEENESKRLHETVLANIIEEFSKADHDGGQSLSVLASTVSWNALQTLATDSLRHREMFDDLEAFLKNNGNYHNTLKMTAGISADETISTAMRDFFATPFWLQEVSSIAESLCQHSVSTNIETGRALASIIAAQGPAHQIEILSALLLKDDGLPRAPTRLITKKFRDTEPVLASRFDGMTENFQALQNRLATIGSIDRSDAAMRFLRAYQSKYKAEKDRRGVLDFDDLIEKARILLNRPDVAPWVLYKLDNGLSHVLVDEAQDTSPGQWDIIDRLSQEFTVGDSSNEKLRTVFAVGDEKQSIYGFQGAAPEAFGVMKERLRQRHRDGSRSFEDIRLVLSFRSTPEVLSAVDRTFSFADHAHGLLFNAPGSSVIHESLRSNAQGFVEIWPQERGVNAEAVPDAWEDADDSIAIAARAALADRIARYARHLIENGDSTGKPVCAGDIMILVRHRGGLFEAIIQALKFYHVAVAGADRLKLNAHIAVKDLLALGRACVVPDDDLNLACLLKSPFFSFDDDDLLQFAPERAGTLFDALAVYANKSDKFRRALAQLQQWTVLAGQRGPFAFYSRILESDGGRHALLRRLGQEATDAINEFMNRAYDFEARRYASLAAFLMEFEGRDIEIKRDFAQGSNEVRVMTVHAAKGLEAPIVILPDTVAQPQLHKAQLVGVTTPEGMTLPFWCAPGQREPSLVQNARAAEALAAEHEYRRLLYVAMTRAENGLVICGARQYDAKPGSWYQMISAALSDGSQRDALTPRGQLTVTDGFDGQPISRWIVPRSTQAEAIESTEAVADNDETAAHEIEPLPAWLNQPAPPPRAKRNVLTPSASVFSGAPSQDDRDTAGARNRGRLIHALLQQLPALPVESRDQASREIARRFGGGIDSESAIADVAALLAQPGLAPLFGTDARAEMSVCGMIRLADGTAQPVLGVVDRLWAGDKEVWIADFKTGASPPRTARATPPGIVSQIALYRAVLQQIFPEKMIRCLVVWTAGPVVHELSDAQLDAALTQITAASHSLDSNGTAA